MKLFISYAVLMVLVALTHCVFLPIGFDEKYAKDIMHEGDKSLSENEWANAIAHYSVAIQEKDSNYWAYCRRGYAYNRLEKTIESLEDYSKGTRLITDVKGSWLRHGHWFFAYHRPIEYECHLNRGKLHRNSGQLEKAKSDFDAVVEIASTAEVHYLRGKVLQKLGDTENALHDANKAVQLDSENQAYRDFQKELLNI